MAGGSRRARPGEPRRRQCLSRPARAQSGQATASRRSASTGAPGARSAQRPTPASPGASSSAASAPSPRRRGSRPWSACSARGAAQALVLPGGLAALPFPGGAPARPASLRSPGTWRRPRHRPPRRVRRGSAPGRAPSLKEQLAAAAARPLAQAGGSLRPRARAARARAGPSRARSIRARRSASWAWTRCSRSSCATRWARPSARRSRPRCSSIIRPSSRSPDTSWRARLRGAPEEPATARATGPGRAAPALVGAIEELSDEEVEPARCQGGARGGSGRATTSWSASAKLSPKRLALLAARAPRAAGGVGDARAQPDRDRRHGLPLPRRRRRPGGVLGAAWRAAATRSARCPPTAGTPTPTTTPTPTRRAASSARTRRLPRSGRRLRRRRSSASRRARPMTMDPAAAPAARGRLGGAGGRRPVAGAARRARDRRVRRHLQRRLLPRGCSTAATRRSTSTSRRATRTASPPAGSPTSWGCTGRRCGRHRLLLVAGRPAPGLPQPAQRRVARWRWPAAST